MDNQEINDREGTEYIVRKLLKEYEKLGLIIKTQTTKYLYIRAKAENLVMEGNKEIRACEKYKYLGIGMNRERIDD